MIPYAVIFWFVDLGLHVASLKQSANSSDRETVSPLFDSFASPSLSLLVRYNVVWTKEDHSLSSAVEPVLQ